MKHSITSPNNPNHTSNLTPLNRLQPRQHDLPNLIGQLLDAQIRIDDLYVLLLLPELAVLAAEPRTPAHTPISQQPAPDAPAIPPDALPTKATTTTTTANAASIDISGICSGIRTSPTSSATTTSISSPTTTTTTSSDGIPQIAHTEPPEELADAALHLALLVDLAAPAAAAPSHLLFEIEEEHDVWAGEADLGRLGPRQGQGRVLLRGAVHDPAVVEAVAYHGAACG